jgi:MFS family permease
MNSHKPIKEIDRSLRACIKEGVASQIMTGIFDYYLTPLAIFLKASTLQIGLLASIPSVLSSFSQIFAVSSVKWMGSRKGVLTKGSIVQACLLLPIPLLVFLPQTLPRIQYLLIFVVIFRVIGSVMGPAWGSIVSDYLPEHLRGIYFGKRAQIISIAGVIGMAFWGIVLSLMNGMEVFAFFIIFLFAALFRFISAHYMHMLIELPQEPSPAYTPIVGLKNYNFKIFVFYISAVTFATQLSAPFAGVYMLEELKFSYFSYMLVNLASLFSGLISFPVWGRNADLVGNLKVLKLTGWLIPLTPIFYMIAKSPSHLMLVEIFNGFIWGGFNLCATNFIYDAALPTQRVQYLCYFNVVNGIALFAGASIGGFLGTKLPEVFGSRLFFLFLISSLCRLLAQKFLFSHIHEVRASYHKVRSTKLFMSVLGIRPLMGHDVEAHTLPNAGKLFAKSTV